MHFNNKVESSGTQIENGNLITSCWCFRNKKQHTAVLLGIDMFPYTYTKLDRYYPYMCLQETLEDFTTQFYYADTTVGLKLSFR